TATSGTIDVALIEVADANCSNVQDDALSVTVLSLPQATLSISQAQICQNGTGLQATFTATSGTAPFVFEYTINGVAHTLNSATATATVDLDTATPGVITVGLTSVSDASCSNPQDDVATATVNPLPLATVVSDVPSACQDADSPVVTFTGSGGVDRSSFTYTVNGGAPQTATATISASILIPTNTVGDVSIALLGVSDALGCGQTLTETLTVSIVALPVALEVTALVICDDNNDGFGCFDISAVGLQATGGDANLVATIHPTMEDAQLNQNAITGATYCSINPNTQTLYVRVS